MEPFGTGFESRPGDAERNRDIGWVGEQTGAMAKNAMRPILDVEGMVNRGLGVCVDSSKEVCGIPSSLSDLIPA